MAPVDIQALGRAIHEVLILAVVKEAPMHGYQIALAVEEETGGVFAFQHGTLYPILHRLAKQGLLRGEWDRSGGRRRKVYELTGAGRGHLEAEWARIEEAFTALGEVMGGVV